MGDETALCVEHLFGVLKQNWNGLRVKHRDVVYLACETFLSLLYTLLSNLTLRSVDSCE